MSSFSTFQQTAIAFMLSCMHPDGDHWEGELSESALATAVAIFALYKQHPTQHQAAIQHGLEWLASHQNTDGGFGDTPDCPSNLSTTLLVWGAAYAVQVSTAIWPPTIKIEHWLQKEVGSLEPAKIADAVIWYYGEDRTFAAPILAMLAMAGRLPWDEVPQLPLELAVFPRWLWRILRLQVVSYAIPALIAIGRVRHESSPGRWVIRHIRRLLMPQLMNMLQYLQPSSGGYLEAIPLTAFVMMSLCHCQDQNHPVTQAALSFLLKSQRANGSWPIDLDLSVWLTSLAVKALISKPVNLQVPSGASSTNTNTNELPLTLEKQEAIARWLLARQTKERHPFTDAAPGAWGWSHHPGSVPDADDTSGVLLALLRLGKLTPDKVQAAQNGIQWLLNLQNSDGGIPTFCRGWGRLPFDQSCNDLTAHALQAFWEWLPLVHNTVLQGRMRRAMLRMVIYLGKQISNAGFWLPRWFGDPQGQNMINPTYGTVQVILGLVACDHTNLPIDPGQEKTAAEQELAQAIMLSQGVQWLHSSQNRDHGWGTNAKAPSDIESSALAIAALSDVVSELQAMNQQLFSQDNDNPTYKMVMDLMKSIKKGITWLDISTQNGKLFPARPIGLYFANLWYSEKLYPVIFTVMALQKTKQWLQE